MPTCKTCKHWDLWPGKPPQNADDDQFGTCKLPDVGDRMRIIVTSSASGGAEYDYTELETCADFGCLAHSLRT